MSTAKPLSFKKAKALFLKVWDYRRKHPDTDSWEIMGKYPELRVLKDISGFCERYLEQLKNHELCPLYTTYKKRKNEIGCCFEYEMWLHALGRYDNTTGRTKAASVARSSTMKSIEYWANRMYNRVLRAQENPVEKGSQVTVNA